MKRILILIFFLTIFSQSQAQQYDIAQLLGGVAGNAYAEATVADNAGNVYVKGVFEGSMLFDTTYYRSSTRDVFMAKFDINGNLLTFKQVGFDQSEDPSFEDGNMTIDNANNIYIIGGFSGDADIEGTMLTNTGQRDIYVIKYDQNLNFVWARNLGTNQFDKGFAITVDNAQNVYIGGALDATNTIVFDSMTIFIPGLQRADFLARLNADGSDEWITIGSGDGCNCNAVYDMDYDVDNDVVHTAGERGSDAWYASYNALDGTEVWSEQPAEPIGSATSAARGIVYDSINNQLYLTGYIDGGSAGPFNQVLFTGTMDTLTGAGRDDIFLLQVDPLTGNGNWANSYGDTRNESGEDISFDLITGDVFITGYYSSDSLVLMGDTLPTANPIASRTPFIASASSAGADGLANPLSTGGFDQGLGIEVDIINQKVYNAGFYSGDSDFGSLQVNQRSTTFYLGSYEVADLSNNWVRTSPKGETIAQFLKVDNNDNVLIAGYLNGTVDFMGTTISSTDITDDPAFPMHDLFIARFLDDGSLDWVVTAGGDDNDEVRALSFDNDGSVYIHGVFADTPTVAGTLLTPADTGDVIVKLTSAGIFSYAVPISVPAGEVTGIQGEADGNDLFVTGYFSGSIALPNNPVLATVSATDIFLFKINAAGTVLAGAKQYGQIGNSFATDLHHEPGGDLFMSGYFDDEIDFDGIDLSTTPIDEEIFVAAFDVGTLDANLAFQDGGTNNQQAELITIDGGGNVTIAGPFFGGAADFSGTVLAGGGVASFFISSYDPAGNFRWAKEIVAADNSFLTGLAGGTNGNVFLSGTTDGVIDVDGTMFTASGDNDAFIVHYDFAGNFIFGDLYGSIYTFGGEVFPGFEFGFDLDVNSSNEVWYTGTLAVFDETFGPFTLQPYGVTMGGDKIGTDSYLLKIITGTATASDPKIYWTENIEDTGEDEIHRVGLDGLSFDRYYQGFSDEIGGLTIDTLNNALYWTDAAKAEIFKADIGPIGFTGAPVNLVDYNPGGTNDLEDLSLDLAQNHMYFTHANAETGFTNKITRADLDGMNITELINLVSEEPFGIDLDLTNGKIYYTTNEPSTGNDARLYRADMPDGANPELLFELSTSGPTIFFRDVKIDVANQRVYWSAGPVDDSPGKIYFRDISDPPFTVPDDSIIFSGEPRGIDIDPVNNKIYWVCRGALDGTVPAAIMRANLDGTSIETVFTVFLYPPGYPGSSDAGSGFLALDLRGLGAPPVNMPPMVTLTGGGATAQVGVPTVIDPGLTVSDPDDTDLVGGDVSVTGNFVSGEDVLAFADQLGITGSYNSGSGVLMLSGLSSVANYQAAMRTITYENSNTVNPDLNNRTISFSVFDGKDPSNTGTKTVTLIPPNMPPAVTVSAATVAYTENAAPAIVDSGITVSDADNSDLQSATITMTGNFDLTEDVLDFTPQGGVTGSYDTLTGVLSLTGQAPLADYQTALQSVTYENTSDNFDAAMGRSVEFVVNDGQDPSNAESVSVQLIPVNDPPVVTTTVNSFNYIIGEGPVVIDPGVTVTDLDNINMASGSIAISVNFVPGEDILGFMDQNGITGSFDGANGILSLTGSSSVTNYQDALRSVTYRNTNPEPDTIQRTISYQVSDGQDSSNIAAAMNEILVSFIPGELEIYNAVSPNGDGKHDWLEIRNIEILFPNNRVEIFNRWGSVVYEIDGYDNTDQNKRFSGISNANNENELPDGTYFYKIDLGDGSPILSGFVVLKK